MFTPSADEVAHAEKVVALFDASPNGLAVLDGKLIEKPVIRSMQRILALRDVHAQTGAISAMTQTAKDVGDRRIRETFGRYFEDFHEGDIYEHRPGRTITETDNTWFTLLTMNTHPMHFDAEYAKHSEFGRCIICSPLTVALMVGMSVTDVSQKAIANMGWTDIRMTHPLFAGDTLTAESEVTIQAREQVPPQCRPRHGEVARLQPGRHPRLRLQSHHPHSQARPRHRRRRRLLTPIPGGSPMLDGLSDDDTMMLDAIDKWLDARREAPCPAPRPRGRVPARDGRADEGDGPLRRDHPAGIRRPRPARRRPMSASSSGSRETWMSLSGIINSHLIMAACVARQGTPCAEGALPAKASPPERSAAASRSPSRMPAPICRRSARRRCATAIDYVVNGEKTWITNGIEGSCYALLVKTDPKADPRHKGMSMFITEKGRGVRGLPQA